MSQIINNQLTSIIVLIIILILILILIFIIVTCFLIILLLFIYIYNNCRCRFFGYNYRCVFFGHNYVRVPESRKQVEFNHITGGVIYNFSSKIVDDHYSLPRKYKKRISRFECSFCDKKVVYSERENKKNEWEFFSNDSSKFYY